MVLFSRGFEYVPRPPPPSLRSFLIADQVFQQASGKWCIIGVFDRIWAMSFPARHPSLGLFIVLADAEGHYDVKIEFRDAEDGVLTTIEGIKIKVESPLATVNFGLQTSDLPLPSPGRYFFKLYFNGEMATVDIPIEASLAESQKREST